MVGDQPSVRNDQDTQLIKNLKGSFATLKRREVYIIVAFIVAYGILNPTYESYAYMFNLNVAKITKM